MGLPGTSPLHALVAYRRSSRVSEPGFGGAVLSSTDFFTSPGECRHKAHAHHTAVGCEIDQMNVESHGLFSLPLSAGASPQQQVHVLNLMGIALRPNQWTNVTLTELGPVARHLQGRCWAGWCVPDAATAAKAGRQAVLR